MKIFAAVILVLASSGTAAMATPTANEGQAMRSKTFEAGSFDLRHVGSSTSTEEGRWRLREVADPQDDDEDMVVRWGWKKVTLRVPLGANR
ncbi:hypothetical protein [Sphingomonas sp. 3-13AW]|jgi:hypothetical protein|uniref:hypothetical protein n=1 Tax=Sphingomonas sp. 3-13AW TaxID=3050450 RepID=UPI003BB66DB2